jgi:hypothetical protein
MHVPHALIDTKVAYTGLPADTIVDCLLHESDAWLLPDVLDRAEGSQYDVVQALLAALTAEPLTLSQQGQVFLALAQYRTVPEDFFERIGRPRRADAVPVMHELPGGRCEMGLASFDDAEPHAVTILGPLLVAPGLVTQRAFACLAPERVVDDPDAPVLGVD